MFTLTSPTSKRSSTLQDSGGNLKILQPEFIGFEDGLRKYTVAYTLNIYKNIISDVEIHVEAIDTYGETTWAMIANLHSLGKRMTTKLAQYAHTIRWVRWGKT